MVISGEKRFCRYLDMPFQHINNEVLEAMNRDIDRAQIESKIHEIQIHLPDLACRTTFIVGFPTETEDSFQELLVFVSAGHFQHVLFASVVVSPMILKALTGQGDWLSRSLHSG